MPAYPETIGVILAGGQSRRMGGRDKAVMEIFGEPMIAHVARRLAGQCKTVVISANGDASRFDFLNMPVVSDGFSGHRGPLAGILAALDWMTEACPAAQWLASIAVDTPFFPGDFVAKLHEERRKKSSLLAMASSGGRKHPVDALWIATLRSDLRNTLSSGDIGKVGSWMAHHDAAVASWSTDPFDPFMNINTPDELEAARALQERTTG